MTKYLFVLKCTNKTLYPVNENENTVGIGYHEVCVRDECGAELWSRATI